VDQEDLMNICRDVDFLRCVLYKLYPANSHKAIPHCL